MDELDFDEERGGRPGAPVDPGRLLQSVLRNWRLIPMVGALALVIGVFYSKSNASAVYSSNVSMLWEGSASAMRDRTPLVTAVESIKLPSNLAEVRSRMKLGLPIDRLAEDLEVRSDKESSLVVLSARAGDPDSAVALANTVVEVFLEYEQRLDRARAEEVLRGLEGDLQIAQASQENAREAVATFNQQHGTEDFVREYQRLEERLVSLRAEVSDAKRRAEQAAKREADLKLQMRSVDPYVHSQGVVENPYASARAQCNSQLAEMASRMAQDHPSLIRKQAECAGIDAQWRGGGTRAAGVSTPNPQYTALQSAAMEAKLEQETQLNNARLAEQEVERVAAQLQEMEPHFGRAQELAMRLDLVDEQVQELQRGRLQARDALRAIAPGFRVVTPALRPEKPDETSSNAAAIKFPAIAMVLVVLGIVAHSMRGLKVHTAREAGFWGNVPVIASSTWPRDPDLLAQLVDEFTDHVPSAAGTTLVVGARPNDVPMAREIAYWLSNISGSLQKALPGQNPTAPKTVYPPPQSEQSGSVALVRVSPQPTEPLYSQMIVQAWDGPTTGQALRRAARHADRVLVVVAAGTLSFVDLWQLRSRLGLSSEAKERVSIGVLLVGLDPRYVRLPDRVGDVDDFWAGQAA